jgi:hypothetical protein
MAALLARKMAAIREPPYPRMSGVSPLRSLVIFNAMFLVQNILDAMYLWGGKQLPAGLTYADYAHRGAYPLMATALLTAVFVLLALRSHNRLR